MSARPDPRQFGRRSDHAGWTLRERIEHRRQRSEQLQARFCACACFVLFLVSLFAALQLDISEGGRALLVVLAFAALVAGQAAASEA